MTSIERLTPEERARWDDMLQRYAPTQNFLWAIANARQYWDEWPLTIVPTRYSGAYEGGEWAAFPVAPIVIGEESWDSGDTEADWWWTGAREANLPIGVGDSPAAALEDLKSKMMVVDVVADQPKLTEGA